MLLYVDIICCKLTKNALELHCYCYIDKILLNHFSHTKEYTFPFDLTKSTPFLINNWLKVTNSYPSS